MRFAILASLMAFSQTASILDEPTEKGKKRPAERSPAVPVVNKRRVESTTAAPTTLDIQVLRSEFLEKMKAYQSALGLLETTTTEYPDEETTRTEYPEEEPVSPIRIDDSDEEHERREDGMGTVTTEYPEPVFRIDVSDDEEEPVTTIAPVDDFAHEEGQVTTIAPVEDFDNEEERLTTIAAQAETTTELMERMEKKFQQMDRLASLLAYQVAKNHTELFMNIAAFLLDIDAPIYSIARITGKAFRNETVPTREEVREAKEWESTLVRSFTDFPPWGRVSDKGAAGNSNSARGEAKLARLAGGSATDLIGLRSLLEVSLIADAKVSRVQQVMVRANAILAKKRILFLRATGFTSFQYAHDHSWSSIQEALKERVFGHRFPKFEALRAYFAGADVRETFDFLHKLGAPASNLAGLFGGGDQRSATRHTRETLFMKRVLSGVSWEQGKLVVHENMDELSKKLDQGMDNREMRWFSALLACAEVPYETRDQLFTGKSGACDPATSNVAIRRFMEPMKPRLQAMDQLASLLALQLSRNQTDMFHNIAAFLFDMGSPFHSLSRILAKARRNTTLSSEEVAQALELEQHLTRPFTSIYSACSASVFENNPSTIQKKFAQMATGSTEDLLGLRVLVDVASIAGIDPTFMKTAIRNANLIANLRRTPAFTPTGLPSLQWCSKSRSRELSSMGWRRLVDLHASFRAIIPHMAGRNMDQEFEILAKLGVSESNLAGLFVPIFSRSIAPRPVIQGNEAGLVREFLQQFCSSNERVRLAPVFQPVAGTLAHWAVNDLERFLLFVKLIKMSQLSQKTILSVLHKSCSALIARTL
jgi:hypothetical protein